jgi:hypothetical protein
MELARKREEQARLEAELAEREQLAAELRSAVAAFDQRYLHFVALRYAELDRWIGPAAGPVAPDAAATGAEEGSGARRVFGSTPEMKRLYREVARRIHPDLTADASERAKRQRLMAEANLAYARGDERALEKILAVFEVSPEAVNGNGPAAELVRVIRRISQIRLRLAEIDAEMQDLLRSELWLLKSRVEEAAESGRDLLSEMIANVDAQIAAAKQRAAAAD